MTKYQELETKIQEMQAEVDRLKKEEEENQLPDGFSYKDCKKVINGNIDILIFTFEWRTTPQGIAHWDKIYSGDSPLTDKDIIQLQKWCILYLENKK